MSGLDLAAALGSILALGAARRLRWLTGSGTAAAVLVGAAVWLGAGAAYLLLLLVFFATSSALSRSLADAPGSGRTGRSGAQVLANGSIAAGAAVVGLLGWLPGYHFAVVGAMAAAASDTWATEIGTAAAWRTRLITNGRPVSPGTSGGVSWPGTAGAVGASLLLGLAAAALVHDPRPATPVLAWPAIALPAGMFGMTIDSILGATLEGRVAWLTNQVVNLAGTAAGALGAWSAALALGLW